jgi:hypothetical protein
MTKSIPPVSLSAAPERDAFGKILGNFHCVASGRWRSDLQFRPSLRYTLAQPAGPLRRPGDLLRA